MKKWLKSENASMTVYVVVAIFSFMIILTSVFLAASAVRKNQLQTIPKIKEAYEKNLSNIQEIYDEREEQEGYIKDGLILHLDAINNTGSGHSNTTNTWKDLSGNGNDATLIGFDTTSGWQENYIKFDGIDDYALSNNNLGLSGDTALTMCAVAEWDADNWMSGYPSYMGNTSYSSYSGLSMTMYDGRPALDFWNYRYIANTPLSTKTIYQICLTKEPRSY